MPNDSWVAVDKTFKHYLVGEDPVLEAALKASEEAELPPIQVAPHEGKLLHMLARLIGAKRILEIGTLGGYSTIWLARALPESGRLITLEYEPKHAEVARANIERAGLSKMVEIKVGKAIDTLPTLAGPFDFIFIDADKPSNPDYFAWALRLSHPGTLIVVDNVVRDGKIADPNNEDAGVQGVLNMFEMIKNEPRVTATALQSVGAKGYDGFAVVSVNR